MSSILGIVQQQQQTPINEDKLWVLCARKKCLRLFWIEQDFLNLSETKQLQLVRKFYFENMSSSSKTNIHSSIGSAIQNPTGLNMTKITESGNDRTEMTLSTSTEEKPVKCINMWKIMAFLSLILAILALKKLTCLGILSTI